MPIAISDRLKLFELFGVPSPSGAFGVAEIVRRKFDGSRSDIRRAI